MAKSDVSERFADAFSTFTIGVGKVLYFFIALTLLGIAIGYSFFDVWREIRAAGDPRRAAPSRSS